MIRNLLAGMLALSLLPAALAAERWVEEEITEGDEVHFTYKLPASWEVNDELQEDNSLLVTIDSPGGDVLIDVWFLDNLGESLSELMDEGKTYFSQDLNYERRKTKSNNDLNVWYSYCDGFEEDIEVEGILAVWQHRKTSCIFFATVPVDVADNFWDDMEDILWSFRGL